MSPMDIASYRESRAISQGQAAIELGLSSRGYFSRLENGFAPIGVKLALKIEAWSAGNVRAIDLLADDDARLLRGAIDNAARAEGAA
jgi:transcriptional regulator with XRE-family HTH domain